MMHIIPEDHSLFSSTSEGKRKTACIYAEQIILRKDTRCLFLLNPKSGYDDYAAALRFLFMN